MGWGNKAEDKSKEVGSLGVVCFVLFLLLGFAINNFYLSGVLALVIFVVGTLSILRLID